MKNARTADSARSAVNVAIAAAAEGVPLASLSSQYPAQSLPSRVPAKVLSKNGSTMRWHASQLTPSKSSAVIAEPFVGSERPPSQPGGEWHRKHKSVAFGRPTAQIESCAATVSAAQNNGSRIACAIIEPCQWKPGFTEGSYASWQLRQRVGASRLTVPGCEPGMRNSGSSSTGSGSHARAVGVPHSAPSRHASAPAPTWRCRLPMGSTYTQRRRDVQGDIAASEVVIKNASTASLDVGG